MKKYLPDYIVLFLIAGAIILIDQLTKFWIRDNLALGQIYRPDLWTNTFVRIIHWKNTGAAFGMFQSGGIIFAVLSSIVSLVIVYYFPQVPRQEWSMRLAMALLLGGAVGNLIDRIYQGHVTDFISVGNFPVFNVADSSISMGVAILFLTMWFQERTRLHAEQVEEASQAQEDQPHEEINPGEPEQNDKPVEAHLSSQSSQE